MLLMPYILPNSIFWSSFFDFFFFFAVFKEVFFFYRDGHFEKLENFLLLFPRLIGSLIS